MEVYEEATLDIGESQIAKHLCFMNWRKLLDCFGLL